MVERRSKIGILVDILRLMQNKEKVKPTHILYGANLSHGRLKKHLASLEEQGFIVKIVEDGNTYYKITQKGLELIQQFRKIKEFSDAFGINI